MKPNLRIDAKHELQSRLYNSVLLEIEKEFVYRSCINCINFREHQGEICGLAMQRPPARVIVLSCPMWEDKDTIPF